MLHDYRHIDPHYRVYIRRAHMLRARAFSHAFRSVARLMRNSLSGLLRALSCRRRRRSAERELLSLGERMLKDIGLSRSQIGSAVRAAMPRDCGGEDAGRSAA